MAGTYADVGSCWAKLSRNCKKDLDNRCREACSCDVAGVLSLVGHSADVSAVLLALIEIPVIGRRLARLIGKTELGQETRERLAGLAAVHDIGKISQAFQHAPFAAVRGTRGHIRSFLSLVVNERCDSHADRQWTRLAEAGGLDRVGTLLLGEEGEWRPLCAALAHHGSLPSPGPADPTLWTERADHDPAAACRSLVDAVEGWLPLAVGAGLDWTPRLGHAFAGLLMLADWIASDTAEFPMADAHGVPDGAARFEWALPRARRLLVRRYLAPHEARAACAALRWEIKSLTGFTEASVAQAAMLSLPSAPAEGRICLIEDETGSGKTEAALIHFLRLFDEGAVDGMYFALPTRAAAVQIHGRIKRGLRALLGSAAPPVILAVPGYLDRASESDAGLPDEAGLWSEEQEDACWASERPKRYLAACVAVGTIDQALLGALQVRHAQLRSSALLRLLLVVDEIHATDVYMTAILRNLLDQHRAAGGHALLMSATLGASARQWLLKPRGTAGRIGPQKAFHTAYPAIWTDGEGLVAAAEPASKEQFKGQPKCVQVTLEPEWREPKRAVALAVEAARRGARVLVIRNTVADVVATQVALEAVAPELPLAVRCADGPVYAPHHARYAPEDRRRLDAALEEALGANVPRHGGSVTVASQTAEQSLDIDADLLITDLCPADVLLQRLGRLHRKRRCDRISVLGFETARVVVLAPSEEELGACLNVNGAMRGARAPLALGLVYPDLLGVVATRRAIEEIGTLSIPQDNRRLVERATHPELLTSLADTLRGNWRRHWEQHSGIKAAQEGAARHACLNWEKKIEPLPQAMWDERITARLGVDDRRVDLPGRMIGPFGGEITSLIVPGRWLRGVPADGEPSIGPALAKGIRLEVGGREFIYDRLGLRPA